MPAKRTCRLCGRDITHTKGGRFDGYSANIEYCPVKVCSRDGSPVRLRAGGVWSCHRGHTSEANEEPCMPDEGGR